MPRVLSYTPDWLSRPNPGYHLFAPKQANGNGVVARKKHDCGPRKTIATRGSEIFVAVGHEIRWADLANLKEGIQPAYRTVRVSVPLPITRLAISPGGDYLAVSTSHTVHVVHLPEPSLLEPTAANQGPIKPKAWQVGPTAHVTEESPVATVLWHPLGCYGRCLVTITKAGVVRLWEVDKSNRATFSEPTLSIDLAKLANATNDQEDLSASKFGATKGFSPDSVYLEVASACFGDSPDQEGVHGWAPMTLWIATVPGDVYALCPLLPSKWQLADSNGTHTLLQTLTSSINVNYADLANDESTPEGELRASERQVEWLSDILYQEPHQEPPLPTGDLVKVFHRPVNVPAVPLLQGPFAISPDVADFELSDMIIYSLKTMSEGSADEAAEGLPTAVVCLLTDTCQVHVCLDLQGVEGRWLPSVEDEHGYVEPPEHELIIAETITLVDSTEPTYSQSITTDVHTDFSFFVSHATGVFYISLEPWIRKLEEELSQQNAEGAEFRLQRHLDSASSIVERHLQRNISGAMTEQEVTSAVVIEDGNIGYMLLTTVHNEPQAAFLDAPEDGALTAEGIAEYMHVSLLPREVREAWQPPKELYEPMDLLNTIKIPPHHRSTMKDEVRLSPSNLELLMQVHRTLSVKTHELQKAVSELFNRATRLQDEFRDQVWRTATVTSQIDEVTGNADSTSNDGSLYGSAVIDERLEKVRSRQERLSSRYEALRSKMNKLSTSQISEKEAKLVEELSTMDGSVTQSSTNLTTDADGSQRPAWERIDKLKALKNDLAERVQKAAKESSGGEERRRDGIKVPSHSRKQENEQIQELMARNRVLVEAATQRLRSLGVGIPMPLEAES